MIEIEYSYGDEWAFDIEELTSEKLVVEDAGMNMNLSIDPPNRIDR